MVQKSALWSLTTIVLVSVFAVGPSFGASALRDKMIAKAKKEKVLVAAGSNARELRTKLKGFKKLYPFIKVKAVKGNTSNTINRVVTEAKANRLTIDLVAIDDAGCELLAKRGLLTRYEYPHLADFIKGTQPTHGLYVDLFGNPRVQGVYNTNMVKPEDVPKNWEEILDPKWKGKTLISRSAEEFPARLAFVWRKKDKLNWDRAFKFFGKLIDNHKPAIARGYSGGNQRVAAGEVAIFWFPAIGTAVRLAVNKKAPVGLIAFPKFPITYRSYGILKGAPNPASSWLMIDYLTSPEGQFDYTSRVSAKSALNKKAKLGKLAKWMNDNGATNINGDLSNPTLTSKVYTEKVLKKSENWYFKKLGIK